MSYDFNMLISDVLKLSVSVLCAGIIGWERQLREKAAGLKTHILICMGACIFTIVGLTYVDMHNAGELLRVFQGIVTGVGFVGAGAIIRENGYVRGLTTAAGIWVTAGIGMAIGSNNYTLAFLCTIFVFAVLRIMSIIEKKLKLLQQLRRKKQKAKRKTDQVEQENIESSS